MKRYAIVLFGLALAACSLSPPAASSPTLTPVAQLCRLPVIQGSKGQGAGPQQQGFLTLPGRVFTAAPDAGDGMYYDTTLKRWVPQGPPALSPDGRLYAYVDGSRTESWVHLRDLGAGTETILAAGGPWQLVGLNSSSAFAMRIEYVDTTAYGTIAVSHGVWQLPLDGTRPMQITSDSLSWLWVDDRAIYAAGSTADVAGHVAPVVRYDLATGKVSQWFDSPGRVITLTVDANGYGLVTTESNDEELWRLPPQGDAVKVWSGPLNAIRPGGPVVVEGSGAWFNSSSPTPAWAIYHYSPTRGLEQVALFTDRPVTVAGACVAS